MYKAVVLLFILLSAFSFAQTPGEPPKVNTKALLPPANSKNATVKPPINKTVPPKAVKKTEIKKPEVKKVEKKEEVKKIKSKTDEKPDVVVEAKNDKIDSQSVNNHPLIASSNNSISIDSLKYKIDLLKHEVAVIQSNNVDNTATYVFFAISLIFTLGMIILYDRAKKSLKKDSINDLKNEITRNLSDKSNSELNRLYREIESLQTKIKQLENNSRNSKSNDEEKYSEKPKIISVQSETPMQQNVISPQGPKYFYNTTPEASGFWKVDYDSNEYLEGASLYKFEKTSESTARFEFDNRSLGRALNNKQYDLDTVCDAENAFNSNAKKIMTRTPGMATKEGDKWIMKSKAKIIYE
jgi:hypothetical protein